VINNIGYSFLLRGDLRKARQKFAEAQAKDPENPTIANNIALVDAAVRRRKGLN
jgi:Flp pilus assembly protein TadD